MRTAAQAHLAFRASRFMLVAPVALFMLEIL